MKNQSKQLMILLLILVFLIAGFFGLKQYNKVQSEKPQEDDTITVIDVAKEDVVKFSYDYEGVTYSFEKEDDVWYYADDHSITLNQNSINAMVNRIAPLTAQQVIKDVTDMTQYGLDEPAKRIQFETTTASYIVELGNFNDVASVYYAKLPSESTVYTVMSPVMTVFNRDLEDLIEEVEETDEETAEESEAESAEVEESIEK